MKLSPQTPRKSLNKAYLKEKVGRVDIDLFKKNLVALFDGINEEESEEHLKNLVADFLKDTWYKEVHAINTKGRQDLVIHTGRTTKEPVGVILEVKRPSNNAEMVSGAKPNAKAMHELILYYLRERIEEENTDIKYLIATNIYEWFIIDQVWFEKNVFRNVKLKKDFETWKLSRNDTRYFYEDIARPFLDKLDEDAPCTYFDIREYLALALAESRKDDTRLIALYKILSPAHLLKQPFSNDSNSLDTKFYAELLNIIGLEEVKDGGKKLIKRKEKPDDASLLENAISKLEDKDCLRNLSRLSSFGSAKQEQLFNIALELCIIWVNRVLFLKLLEAQLFKYHKGDRNYLFLNARTVSDFDELNSLFFQVLAEKQSNRREHLKEKFDKVPYLNSSLFERTELERQTVDIGGLDNRLPLPLYSGTVLKDDKGKRRTGKLPTLQYLFEFLDSYDFTSEGSEEIQEENKNLINASVLGLIFEKINGYKDGSFFTPGFITMYMCRETLRRAVIQKFNDRCKIDCETFEDLKNFTGSRFKARDVLEFNAVINELKICDPAVGSGHFLVSALNEIIAIKAELGILADKEGARLSKHEVKIENDELIVTYDNDTEIFAYTVTGNSVNKETQRIQKTLFHEKETLIENCLFGVDINPNSVKICRLRLWIELLKSAYYKEESRYTELETLPNIDINIKCGNSLISRFPLDSDLRDAQKKNKSSVLDYRQAVHTYHNADTKEQKRSMEILIESIKKNFREAIINLDPRAVLKETLTGKLFNLANQGRLFELSAAEIKSREKKQEKLEKEIAALTAEIEEMKNSKVYENALEWRFEFPEVLDADGKFTGFDVVIGNPPYIRQEEIKEIKPALKAEGYECFNGTADLLVYFYERGVKLLRKGGSISLITSNKYYRAGYGEELRAFLTRELTLHTLVDFGDAPVFEAIAYASILAGTRVAPAKGASALAYTWETEMPLMGIAEIIPEHGQQILQTELKPTGWHLESPAVFGLLEKLHKAGKPFGEYVNGKFYYGIKTGLNEAFVVDRETRDRLIAEHKSSADVLKPFLRGRDVKRWRTEPKDLWLIFTRQGIDIKKYPAVIQHLAQYKKQLMPGGPVGRKPGSYEWYEIQDNVAYWQEFEKAKIVIPAIEQRAAYALDLKGHYSNDKTSICIAENPKYLLGLLNSNLLWWVIRKTAASRQGGFFEFKPMYVTKLPIANATAKQQTSITTLVDRILAAKEKNADTGKWEREIDELVYELYDLTEEEIRIVAGAEK